MVPNGTMGLLDRRVMTRDHGPWTRACETNGPFLACCSIPESLLWHGRPGMAENGAMGPLCSSSSLLRALDRGFDRTLRFDFGFSTAFRFENRGPIVVFSDKTRSILCTWAPLRRFLPSSMGHNQRPGKRGNIIAGYIRNTISL